MPSLRHWPVAWKWFERTCPVTSLPILIASSTALRKWMPATEPGQARDGELDALGAQEARDHPPTGGRDAGVGARYSGWFGVPSSGVQAGSGTVAAFPSVSPARMAVTGRHRA